MSFWTYIQNNSGGFFEGPARVVIVEADTPDEADKVAEARAGLYFDGNGDCACCGNRWTSMWALELGSDEPAIYGVPVLGYMEKNSGCDSVNIYYAGTAEPLEVRR